MSKELLKKAAAEIQALREANTKLAADLESANSDKAKVEQQAKTAADQADKQTEAAKATLADKAKTAADALYERGLFTSDERRDQFAACVLGNHGEALAALAKVASHVSATPKVGEVVLANGNQPETADQAWDRAISAYAR